MSQKRRVENYPVYKWWLDKRVLGTVLLLSLITLQIFAFFKIPFATTIHAYTVGMFFGFFGPFFYLFFIYISLKMIFDSKLKRPKWIKFNKLSYWAFSLALIFFVSTIVYMQLIIFSGFSLKPWGSFNLWFDHFISGVAWAPATNNVGLIGTFLYSIFAMISTNIGAIIISSLLLPLALFYFGLKTLRAFIKRKESEELIKLQAKEIINVAPQPAIRDESKIPPVIEDNIEVAKEPEIVEKTSDDLPFYDPFSDI